MWNDSKVHFAVGSFVLFFVVWGVLSLLLKIDVSNPFLAFVATATTTAWNLILVFIRPDGGNNKPKDEQKIDVPIVETIETQK